jgi:hypothetical protein
MSEFIVHKEEPPDPKRFGRPRLPDPDWLPVVLAGGGEWFAVEQVIVGKKRVVPTSRCDLLRRKYPALLMTYRRTTNESRQKIITYYARLKPDKEST